MLSIRFCGAILIAASVDGPSHGQVRPGRGPLIGFVHHGSVWTATDAETATNSCSVFQGDLCPSAAPKVFFLYSFKDLDHPYCWRIGNNLFWQGTGHLSRENRIKRVRLTDFDLFDSRDSKTRTAKIERRYPDDKNLDQMILWAEPAIRLGNDLEDRVRGRHNTEVYFDFLPTGERRLSLFLLHNKSIRLIRGEFTEAPKDKRAWHWWEYKWEKEPREIISANFHVPFIVYPAKDTYYFFTQFCECYGLRWNWKGYRQTVSLWSKEDQPIARLITDTATGKTFAFTLPLERKDGTKAKPGYFELSANPQLIEHDPAKIKKNDFEYPYKQIRECVDILLADKMIDPVKHKSPTK